MQNTIISIDTRTFLISFQFQNTNGKFIFKTSFDLMKILKDHDKNGIESIKEFNPVKDNFIKVSKIDILKFCSWETEVSEFLKNHYYFKK